VKEIVEQEITDYTKNLQSRVKQDTPDAKSLLNLDSPQLSLHRVKGIMEKNSDLTVGTEVAINVKAMTERRIKQITSQAERNAKDERLSTIKKRHIPLSVVANEEEGERDEECPVEMDASAAGPSGGFFFHDGLKAVCRQYSGMKIDPEAIEEIGYWIEDSAEREILNIEKSFKEKEAISIIASYNRISGMLSQVVIKKVLQQAEVLAGERNKRSIGIEEITDAFSRAYLR